MRKETRDGYDENAGMYADMVETRPIYAYYERPAIQSLLPDLAGATVLDAGCGNGWWTRTLMAQGATVTAVDRSAGLVALAQAEVGDTARVLQADLGEPLSFAQDGEFDLVVASLVIHYLEDWLALLREFHRILKSDGLLVFSTHHPFNDWKLFETDSYFDRELLHDEFDCGPVSFYRRPLMQMCADLRRAGFTIDQLLEPQPLPEMAQVNEELYQRLSTNPWFLVIRVGKERTAIHE